MEMGIFCVKDRAIDAYGNPMFMQTKGQAVRTFTDEVNRENKESNLYLHPDDFDLYFLGTYDSQSGSFVTGAPELVCRGKDVSLTFKVSN